MIAALDHLVLTTEHEETCIAFYTGLLGMELQSFGAGRRAFRFGDQKINLHLKGREFEPKARIPQPGALDLCLLAAIPLEEVIARLHAAGMTIEEGPVARTGARGPIRSVYLRDPDGNLIEISSYG
ncbi:VOC family protein [Mangrovicoccus algicola]|uniref:VOC family protein n=1 Tax=Mangrovicoccus algicola TaxID=2771008 RepID=A0A8J6Z810_9RHOB|nr:VOC family protein [Mangrovicoccus algicola]MBE3637511.1 VOC family protein [Mangrovicoccus algicola]